MPKSFLEEFPRFEGLDVRVSIKTNRTYMKSNTNNDYMFNNDFLKLLVSTDSVMYMHVSGTFQTNHLSIYPDL